MIFVVTLHVLALWALILFIDPPHLSDVVNKVFESLLTKLIFQVDDFLCISFGDMYQ